jgi:hypothetical protein
MDKQLTPEYEPYGVEWENEMSKFPKPPLIKMLGKEFQHVKSLQSRIAELEREISGLKYDAEIDESRNAELERDLSIKTIERDDFCHWLEAAQQLNEKLMGELEEQVKNPPLYTSDHPELRWQSYCKEKGLTPNKTNP